MDLIKDTGRYVRSGKVTFHLLEWLRRPDHPWEALVSLLSRPCYARSSDFPSFCLKFSQIIACHPISSILSTLIQVERVWVVQELSLRRQVTILCRSKRVDFQAFPLIYTCFLQMDEETIRCLFQKRRKGDSCHSF